MSWLKKAGIVSALGLFTVAPFAVVLASKLNTKTDSGIEIVGEGSSSVNPLMRAISEQTNYSIQYTANGSGAGKESQGKDEIVSAFGMMSSTKTPSGTEVANWKKHNVRTVTWAIDAISIVLNMPDDIKIENNEQPRIKIDELSKLYDTDPNTTTTCGALLDNKATGAVGLALKPRAFGRQGGKESSGTSDGFWHTLKDNMADGLTPGTKLTPDFNHAQIPTSQQTPESNAQSIEIAKTEDNSISYISLGYALNNVANSPLTIAQINDGTEIWVPTIENAKNGDYKWVRPFNIAFSIDNKEAEKFAWFLLSPEVQNIVETTSFIKLSNDKINWQSDLSLDDEAMFTKYNSNTSFAVQTTEGLINGLKV